ncbi:hypothetical protein B0H13DRAFT_2372630 [Mycena leptocephala]|nr:hypothetical protein B0H13DRAFT_2372630 [Mycena leptocephala]
MFDPMYADPAPTGEESRRVTPIAPEPFSWWDYYLQSPVYEERAICGMYDELADTLTEMGRKALGNLDCPEDFNRYQATPTSNVEFKDSDGYELRTMIVGEIAGSAHGTVLRAIGNYYIAADFKPIDDTNRGVKDILALVMPTHSTTRLSNFWANQTVPLRSAIDVEIGMESDAGEEYLIRPWMRSVDNSNEDDVILLLLFIFKPDPASAGAPQAAPATPVRRAKRKLDDDTPLSSSLSAISPQVAADRIADAKKDVRTPNASDIKLGAYYDPRLLSDYGARCPGWHSLWKGALIPPYNFYERLKPGTLVLVQASLHKKRKIYQINAHSIKVLADSDAPVEPRPIQFPRNWEGSAAPTAATTEFTNFSLKSSPVKATSVASTSKASGSSAGSTSTLDEFEYVESGDIPKNGEDIKAAKKSKKRVA